MSVSVPAPAKGASSDGPNENPMMNDLVLLNVFQYVKSSWDISRCRRVCKKWNSMILPSILAKDRPVTLYGVDHSDPNYPRTHRSDCWMDKKYGWCCCFPTEDRSIKSFVKMISSNTLGYPFSKFNLECFETRANDKDRKKFFQLCGGGVKEITAKKCTVKHVREILLNVPNLEYFITPRSFAANETGEVVKLFPDNLKSKPNLTHLKTFEIQMGFKGYTKKVCPTFFQELIGVAENISTIYMGSAHDEDILEVLNTLEASNVESIDNLVLMDVNQAHLEVLKKMIGRSNNGLKLKSLIVIEGGWFDAENARFQLVELCKNDLVKYHSNHSNRNREQEPTDTTVEFPQMAKLKILTLGLPNRTSLQSNNFKKNFPVLEKINLSSNINIDELFTGDQPSGLKKLFIKKILLEIRTFDRITFICPSLKVFSLRVAEDGIRIVQKLWGHFTQLEELNLGIEIKTKFNIDCLISGVSSRECQKIKKNQKYWEPFIKMSQKMRAVKLLALGDKLRVDPSISALPKLRRLTITVPPDDDQPDHISDITGYLGFYSMKCLRHIRINKCQLTRSCCDILVTDMGLQSREFGTTGIPGRRLVDVVIYEVPYPYHNEDWDNY